MTIFGVLLFIYNAYIAYLIHLGYIMFVVTRSCLIDGSNSSAIGTTAHIRRRVF